MSHNAATNGAGGGIYAFFGATVQIENSTLSGNRSTGWHGGAIFQTDRALTLTNGPTRTHLPQPRGARRSRTDPRVHPQTSAAYRDPRVRRAMPGRSNANRERPPRR